MPSLRTKRPPPKSTDPKVIRFLSNPNSYPHRPRRIELIQTHASYIFIVPPFVYKVKKPVNFGFLDFSTLEKRHFFCNRELELNRRLSPKVYLEVVPICSGSNKLSFGGKGAPIEYALKMRQLSKARFLDELVDRRQVTTKVLERVAAVLTRFYETHPPTAEIKQWGRIQMLKISTNENFSQTEQFIGSTLSRVAFDTIRRYTSAFYSNHRALFDSRIRDQRIRDCHGDLHLNHIHLGPRVIEIFDCIEFNDRLRYIDIANDLAFLAMDLDFHGRPELASFFIRKMAQKLRDPGLLKLLNFYKCYRAYVRGKVESFNGAAPETPEPQRRASRQKAQRYFRLALHYAASGTVPGVLVVMGRIGSGKSTLAEALAGELGWKILSSDRTRKELAGLPVNQRTSAALREKLYRPHMTLRVYRELGRNVLRALQEGRSILVDATFSRRVQRDVFRKLIAGKHAEPGFIEAAAPENKLKERLRMRGRRAVSDARLEDFDRINRSYEPPSEIERSRGGRISTDRPVSEAVAEVLQRMALEEARRRVC
jgi:uncharacterized protein